MQIKRHFTQAGKTPYANIPFAKVRSEVRDISGEAISEAIEFEAPESWSQVACDILAQKYFRRAGVPTHVKRVNEDGIPDWLRRSAADDTKPKRGKKLFKYGQERDARQVFDRLAGCWTYWGWRAAILTPKKTLVIFTMNCALCSPRKSRRLTPRSGLIPGFIGLMASTGLPRVIAMSITKVVN